MSPGSTCAPHSQSLFRMQPLVFACESIPSRLRILLLFKISSPSPHPPALNLQDLDELGKEGSAGQGARNELEAEVVQAVAAVLGRASESLSIFDNFFDMGGHSLSATRLVTRLNKALQVCGRVCSAEFMLRWVCIVCSCACYVGIWVRARRIGCLWGYVYRARFRTPVRRCWSPYKPSSGIDTR